VGRERIVSAGTDGTVRVWDVESAEEVARLTGHTDAGWSVSFSPDGRRVVSVDLLDDYGRGSTVRVWDVESGEEVAQFRTHRLGWDRWYGARVGYREWNGSSTNKGGR